MYRYFKVYDTEDRQGLLEAYHDQAMLSMCVNTETFLKDHSGQRGPSLGEYLKNSRNMKRVTELERRNSLLKHSRLSVVAFLNELPQTKHELTSFTVDVNLALPTCLSFAVRGLFLENSKTFRSFTRVFLAVPTVNGKGLSIINDELHIRNPSSAQIEGAARETVASTESIGTLQASPALNRFSSENSSVQESNPQQEEMVLQFSQQSAMNVQWSYKCLSENEWNYDKAALVFTSLKESGRIPPEAFVK